MSTTEAVRSGRTEAAAAGGRRTAFDVVRIVSIVGVVAIHTFSRVITTSTAHSGGSWWVAVTLDLGFVWAVPVFVMLSGALGLRESAFRSGVGPYYRKRAVRLLPALVFWNVCYVVVIRMLVNGAALAPSQLLTLAYDGKLYTQLYFLWIVLGLSLAAPVIAPFLHAGGERRAFVFAGVLLVGTAIVFTSPVVLAAAGVQRPITLSFLTMWIPYLGFFVAGYALGARRFGRRTTVAAAVVAAISLAVTIVQYGAPGAFPVLGLVSPISYYSAIVIVASLAVFIALVGVADRLPFGPRALRAIRTLSDAAFGVFLVHLAVVAVLGRIVPELNAGTSLGLTAVLFAVTVVLSFAISIVARRIPYVRRVF